MSIRFACSGCGSQLKVADEKAGSSGKCPKCGAVVSIPATRDPEQASVAELAAPPVMPSPPPAVDEFPSFPAIETDLPRRRPANGSASRGMTSGDYRPAGTLTAVAVALLGAMLVLDGGAWVISILQFLALQAIPPYQPVDEMALTRIDLVEGGLALLYVPLYLACVVSFLMWKYRANRNAAVLSGRALEISPGWSVGWYFVPIMNLFRPYQAMKEIWAVSGVRRRSTNLLTIWWTLWVVSNIGGNIALRMELRAKTAGDLRGTTFFGMVLGLVDVPLCIAAILVVRRLYAMQQEKAGNV